MSDWDDFTCLANLRLAWDRVVRSKHGDTKDRLALKAYGFSLESNLASLRSRLIEDTFRPSETPKLHLPKKVGGTLRTIPMLTVSDRLVYQAICNVVVRKTEARFRAVADRQVYAHLPSSSDSPFPVRQWQKQYRGFTLALEKACRKKDTFLVETDIAAFYDSVGHGLLIDMLQREWQIDERLASLLTVCLQEWRREEANRDVGRGIPQGYEPSDLLSTLFLSSIDQAMTNWTEGEGVYLRYVDDIRMLFRDEETALRGLLELDIQMKNVGLILQVGKTAIRRIADPDDERDTQWAHLSLIDRAPPGIVNRPQGELRDLFFQAVAALDEDEFAESHLVFALGRLDRYDDVRDEVLNLLERLPGRSGNLTRYLARYRGDRKAIDGLKQFLTKHRVYGSHLANCLRCLTAIAQPADYHDICTSWVRNVNLRWYQRLPAAEALGTMQDSLTLCDELWRQEKEPVVRRALLKSRYALAVGDPDMREEIIRDMAGDKYEETRRLAIYLLSTDPEWQTRKLPDLRDELGDQSCLLTSTIGERPPVGRTLADFFNVSEILDVDFRAILGASYDEALRHLRIAVGARDTALPQYFRGMDDFNHLLTQGIYKRFLPQVAFQADSPVRNWEGTVLSDAYPMATAAFLMCHRARTSYHESSSDPSILSGYLVKPDYPHGSRVTKALTAAYAVIASLLLGKDTELITVAMQTNEGKRQARVPQSEQEQWHVLPRRLELDAVLTTTEGAPRLSYTLNDPVERFYYRTPAGFVTFTSDQPRDILQNTFNRLSALARSSSGRRTDEEERHSRETIEDCGHNLYEQVWSPDLQTHYETIRKRYPQARFLISSNEPSIPWEIIRPFKSDQHGAIVYDDPTLCEMFQLSHWIAGNSLPQSILLQNIVLVTSPASLPSGGETSYFQALSQKAPHFQVKQPLQSLAEVLDDFILGTTHLYHFACHGNFKIDDPAGSKLLLDGGSLAVDQISGLKQAGIRRSKPLVFVNACHSGESGYGLTRLDGWAQRFISSGASAFIGTLWEISDALAALFAQEFYDRFFGLEGHPSMTLGQAFFEARSIIKGMDDANPTWLAYIMYGDPDLRLAPATKSTNGNPEDETDLQAR